MHEVKTYKSHRSFHKSIQRPQKIVAIKRSQQTLTIGTNLKFTKFLEGIYNVRVKNSKKFLPKILICIYCQTLKSMIDWNFLRR